MDLFSLFGNIYFEDFSEVVDYMCSAAPVLILTVFTVNLTFSIFDVIFHLGGRN